MRHRPGTTAIKSIIDELDLRILRLLQEDGRMSLVEIGKRLGVSHATVRYRLERLTARQIVTVRAYVDPTKVGFPTQVLIGIRADLGSMESIDKQLAQLEELYFVSTVTGRFDFFVAGAFASDSDLRDFLAKKLSKVKGIHGAETFGILRMERHAWPWRVPTVMASVRSKP